MESLKEQLEIFVSCRNLTNMDVFSLTDTQITLLIMNENKKWTKIGDTEIVWDNLNPNFLKTFIIDYYFEKQQHMRFEIYDRDENSSVKNEIGIVECTVGSLFGSQNKTLLLPIKSKQNKDCGKIILRCDNVYTSSDNSQFSIIVNNINFTRMFSIFNPIKPFIRIYKITEDKQSYFIYETESHEGNSVRFNKFNLNNGRLCNDNDQIQIDFQLWDKHSNGNHQLIGSFKTNLHAINVQEQRRFIFINNKGKQIALLFIDNFTITKRYSFLDYIRGGLQLNLVTAIDFTGSNGHPQDINSLHSMRDIKKNLYIQSLKSVGDILINYDSDKLVPMYGFGGIPKMQNMHDKFVSHCFPLTGDVNNPNAIEVEGMTMVYQHAIQNCDLAGPTYFGPLLQQVKQSATLLQKSSDNDYIILLILTDGQINDMPETIRTIIDCCNLPLSIVIVGLGDADFTNMEILDGDNGLQDNKGRAATRDLVQFVPFNKFQNNSEKLAEQVLEEIPRQVVEYFKGQSINPKPKVPHLDDSYIRKMTPVQDL